MMKPDTNRIAKDILVLARAILGGSLKGWLDPHGKFYSVPGGLTHEEVARKLWIGKTKLEDTRSSFWGSDRMYENGWFRVVPYGSDTLSATSAHSTRGSTHSLSDIQVHRLREMAIDAGMTKVVMDNGNTFKVVWADDSELMVARTILGFEFPTKEALDVYLKAHPKAKKDNHWVQNQKPEKKVEKQETVEKTVDSTKKSEFKLPESKMVKYEAGGTLGDIEKWKAKIIIGNSMGKDKKVGQMDEVGYVGINTRTNEIVPIARADEHRAGYELLYHLSEKGAIKGNPEDFITLFPSTNYPHYMTNDTHKYAQAVQKWLDYGGPNVVVHAQGVKKGGSLMNRKDYVTDMEEYAALDGNVPYGQKGPSKPAREMLENLEGAIAGVKSGDQSAFDKAKMAADRMNTFHSYTLRHFDDGVVFDKEIKEAKSEKDIGKLGQVLGKMAKELQDSLNQERGSKMSSYYPGFYGEGDDSDKRLGKMAGVDMAPVKKEGEIEKSSLSNSGQEVIGHFEKAARAVSKGLTMPGTMGTSFDRMQEEATGLVAKLQPMMDDVDGLGAALERVHRAVDKQDGDELQQALFAFNGVKNLLHNRLRKMQKDGIVKDKHFGDVKKALDEFDRLGQI